MSTTPTSIHPHRPTSRLVLSRNPGEGFSLGGQWRFDVLDLCARFVTFAVTGGSHSTTWQLEVGDALQISADDSIACRRRSQSEPGSREVRVTRVTLYRVTVLIYVPRALEIARHDFHLTYRRAA